MSKYSAMVRNVKLPKMALVRQTFERERLEDIPGEIRKQLSRPEICGQIKPGMRIGITGGSRGVANIALIIREIASFIKEKGAQPFVFPAMGSHGGATAAGQQEILDSYGITEEYCGCPICATMETKTIGTTEEGHEVQIDKYAAEADGYIAVNRIKPHTAFRGPYESGLMKMLTIGVGKQRGAEVTHTAGFGEMHHLVPLFGKAIMKHSNLLFGVSTIENAYDDTYRIDALTPEEIITEEPKLLLIAKAKMGSLLFEETDLLVIDEIGKNISGDGADPNISGRFIGPHATGGIKNQLVVTLSLTEESHGSAAGVGIFDAVSKRLYDQTDFEVTYPNAITNTVLLTVKMPIVMDNDRDTIAVGVKCCNKIDYANPRIIRIKNTAHIEDIYISEALMEEAKANPNIEILSEPQPFVFNEEGNLW
ncbi:MAG: lactate racemase domain-containing protein [Christensenella sp.]|uniref:lactate racemase domain-containing protein n=1 Tax=Christensenella sp. TaxID=1935934 RepID=UPI002B1F68C7|nr:lactate racemase domain-containing protein [Christensenella sp.]MEA5001976.1 lactate racemase domain-containing protein [Christensenella sp.]